MNEIKKYFLPALIIFLSFVFFVNIFDSDSGNNSFVNKEYEILDDNQEIDNNIKVDIVFDRPKNGFSPYNSFCGVGVYDKSTENTIVVTAPKNYDIVIFIKDINSGKNIRNEYIRSNTTFNLTSIPYGDFKFVYIYGNNWDSGAGFKNGLYKGNFVADKGVSKSDKNIDVSFERNYSGTYSITLQSISNGNLNTVSGNENEI